MNNTRIERTKNSIKGILSGIINKIVVLIAPFIVRTIFINTLGIEYLGLNSLFSSILNILNLAELGIGSAIVFSLYESIAKEDKAEICALMNFYKKTYRIIGFLVISIGLIILPFIKILCNDTVPNDIDIYVIYILYLINSSLTYFLYAYKICLLTAHQQTYVTNNINTIVYLLLNISQGIFLLLGKGYYTYLVLVILATISNNLLNACYVTKKYHQYKPDGNLSFEKKKSIVQKIKALFFYKVGAVVLTSVDSVVISYFLGLEILGKYNNYYYVITTLFGFVQVYINALLAGVGNSIVSEDLEKNISDFKKLNFIHGWVIGWCSICLVCLYQPFMNIWIGNKNMFPLGVAISLSIYFYVWKMMDIVNLYKEAAGLWEYDKYRPIIASIVNLILNIILVQLIGIYGIILSTILSIILIILPWSTYILYKIYFKNGYGQYWINYIRNLVITLFTGLIVFKICSMIETDSLIALIIKGIICLIIPNIFFLLFYKNTNIFKETMDWIIDKLKIYVLGNVKQMK